MYDRRQCPAAKQLAQHPGAGISCHADGVCNTTAAQSPVSPRNSAMQQLAHPHRALQHFCGHRPSWQTCPACAEISNMLQGRFSSCSCSSVATCSAVVALSQLCCSLSVCSPHLFCPRHPEPGAVLRRVKLQTVNRKALGTTCGHRFERYRSRDCACWQLMT